MKMRAFRGDLHIHTTLSPCGDLGMSPERIVSEAAAKGLDIIGITDHNTTRHCSLTERLAARKGIFVMQGAEVTTREEVHCLVFFENSDALGKFQEYLDENLPEIENHPLIFGDQVQVDEEENIIYEEKRLLANALTKSIGEVEAFVHGVGGLFIPAHIDRRKNSIFSQLGFLPDDLYADALEVSKASSPAQFAAAHPEVERFTLITSSDAHFPGSLRTVCTSYHLEYPSFGEIRKALASADGRRAEIL